jgi:hypothetical protein
MYGAIGSLKMCYCHASSRVTFIQGAAGALHFFEDVASSGGPNERFRTLVVTVDEGADGHDELFEVAENPTS